MMFYTQLTPRDDHSKGSNIRFRRVWEITRQNGKTSTADSCTLHTVFKSTAPILLLQIHLQPLVCWMFLPIGGLTPSSLSLKSLVSTSGMVSIQ